MEFFNSFGLGCSAKSTSTVFADYLPVISLQHTWRLTFAGQKMLSKSPFPLVWIQILLEEKEYATLCRHAASTRASVWSLGAYCNSKTFFSSTDGWRMWASVLFRPKLMNPTPSADGQRTRNVGLQVVDGPVP
ncbi:13886_t:CDS:1 [Acaulospora colombiana]|uniref:13886_t:CDS:1 n=1 Tax=Acaulospora colombiana TaxID=27376 RepID=A0ACA9NSY2_9GLOM|nr:13886_t:CDS:1 [Acaulospora colombiana]